MILAVSYDEGRSPVKNPLLFENKLRADIQFDTGSAISAVLIKRFCRDFVNHKIFPTNFQLRTTGENFKPSRYVNEDVSCDDETKYVRLYMIKENNFQLVFDRDCIPNLNIIPYKLKSVYVKEVANSSNSLEALLTQFYVLFTNKVGKMSEGRNPSRKNATRIFCKARIVDYALLPQ